MLQEAHNRNGEGNGFFGREGGFIITHNTHTRQKASQRLADTPAAALLFFPFRLCQQKTRISSSRTAGARYVLCCRSLTPERERATEKCVGCTSAIHITTTSLRARARFKTRERSGTAVGARARATLPSAVVAFFKGATSDVKLSQPMMMTDGDEHARIPKEGIIMRHNSAVDSLVAARCRAQ